MATEVVVPTSSRYDGLAAGSVQPILWNPLSSGHFLQLHLV